MNISRCQCLYILGQRAAIGLLTLTIAACDLGVTNPGPIADDALNTRSAMEPLVNGMASDLSAVYDDVGYYMGIASGDITHTGVFEPEQFMQVGDILPRHVNDLWSEMHRARWTAETGIERMREVLGDEFNSSPLPIQAYIWAGYANRVLGENVCQAVIDGGAPQPVAVHFGRAEEQFTHAIQLAEQQGESALLERAYAGRAQVRLALEDWSGAASDAAQVPDAFEFEAMYSDATGREYNWLANQSQLRDYFSVYSTFAVPLQDDPRITWTDMNRIAVDGLTPMYMQQKYPGLGSSIDLAAGDEMRLIEAEAALRLNNDVDEAMAKINSVRGAAGAESSTASAMDEAWAALRREREIVLWMEGRRLWDLRRFNDPFLNDRDNCIPISENEVNTNPNIPG